MIKVFEMFCGMGGASFALKKAGVEFELVGFSEIDKYAIQIFNQNHNKDGKIKNYGDCRKIVPEQLPDFDLLTGGFPCTDVSVAGARDLSKGRTKLFDEIIRIAIIKKPRYMLLENVKGLISIEDGSYFDHIQLALKKAGYGVTWRVLNSMNHGIPQNRERVWFACKYGGWDFMEFAFPEKETLTISVKDILEENVDEKYYLKPHQLKLLEKTQNDNPTFDINIADFRLDEGLRVRKEEGICYCLNAKDRSETDITSMPPILIMNCLTEAQGRQGSSDEFISAINLIHKITGKARRLTARETFRLMGFLKDEIDISGITDSQLYKISGNGWDISVASKIFNNMFLRKSQIC